MTKLFRTFSATAICFGGMMGSAWAQDDLPPVNNGSLSWELGADVVSAYIFRGIEQEDSGLIVQPYVQVSGPVGETGIGFYVGSWQSIHSDDTGTGAIQSTDAFGAPNGGTATGSPTEWYESDFYAGLDYQLDKVTFGVLYTAFFSPNGAFSEVEEIGFSLAYDDLELLGDFAFNPYVFIAFQTDDQSVGPVGSEDIYLELGGEFSTPFLDSEQFPVKVTIPFVLGFSLDDFYTDAAGNNEGFGFLKVGPAFQFPVDFIPSDYGIWEATAGVDLFFVNDDALLLDDGDDFEIVGRLGIALRY
ncbi:MAG: TorF family putative porin [Planctomycetota bacterium]